MYCNYIFLYSYFYVFHTHSYPSLDSSILVYSALLLYENMLTTRVYIFLDYYLNCLYLSGNIYLADTASVKTYRQGGEEATLPPDSSSFAGYLSIKGGHRHVCGEASPTLYSNYILFDFT